MFRRHLNPNINGRQLSKLNDFFYSIISKITLQDGPYETVSGLILRDFISIWPALRDPRLFQQLVRIVSRSLEAHCDEVGANLVVGCSTTIKHLFEGVQGEIEAGIELLHLGSHPKRTLA